MNASSEFIRGYTEIIILSNLYKKDDYIYNNYKSFIINHFEKNM